MRKLREPDYRTVETVTVERTNSDGTTSKTITVTHRDHYGPRDVEEPHLLGSSFTTHRESWTD